MLSLCSFAVDPHKHRLSIVGVYKFLVSVKTLSNCVAAILFYDFVFEPTNAFGYLHVLSGVKTLSNSAAVIFDFG